jgi:hypothetical protein
MNRIPLTTFIVLTAVTFFTHVKTPGESMIS